MNLSTVWTIFKQIVDVCFVWVIIYYVLKNIRRNIKLSLLIKGIIVIILVKIISEK